MSQSAIARLSSFSLDFGGLQEKLRAWRDTALATSGVIGTLCLYDPLLRAASPFPDEFYNQVSSDMARSINRVLGPTANITTRAEGLENVPKENGPYIIVANHQSMFDITLIADYLSRLAPRYISKIELAKNIPGVSFNLRRGGSACIDRKDPKQALEAIETLARRIIPDRLSVVIFPEGTRSKTGKMKSFREGGLRTLIEHAPGVPILPLTLTGGSKVFRYDLKPIVSNVEMLLRAHPVVQAPDPAQPEAFQTFLRTLEKTIEAALPSEEQGGLSPKGGASNV